MTIERAYYTLIEENIATEDELVLITDIWGYNLDTLEKVLYARTGLNDFFQLDEELNRESEKVVEND